MNFKYLGIFVVLLASRAVASMIYVDFCVGGNTTLPSTYAAAALDPGFWNGVDAVVGTTPNLLGLDGNQTSVSLTVSATMSNRININRDPQTLNTLLRDCLYADIGYSWGVTFSGLENGEYDVYIYAPGHALIATWNYTLNGVVHSNPIYGGSDAVLDAGYDYEITRATVSDGLLSISGASGSGGGGHNGLAGLQVVAIPEPATAGLVGLSFGVLYIFRRLKNYYRT